MRCIIFLDGGGNGAWTRDRPGKGTFAYAGAKSSERRVVGMGHGIDNGARMDHGSGVGLDDGIDDSAGLEKGLGVRTDDIPEAWRCVTRCHLRPKTSDDLHVATGSGPPPTLCTPLEGTFVPLPSNTAQHAT